MTLTRWKLMAGVLGLSLCGLAALAEPACRTVGYAQRKPDDKPQPVADVGAKPLPPPVDVTPPKPEPLPIPAPLVLPKSDAPPASTEVPPPPPLPAPRAEPIPAPEAVKSLPLPTLPEPKVVDGGLDEKAFTELAKQSLKLPELPKLDAKKENPLPTPGDQANPRRTVDYKFDNTPVFVPQVATRVESPNQTPAAPTLPGAGGRAVGYKLDDGRVIVDLPKTADPFLPAQTLAPSSPLPVKAEVPSLPPQNLTPAPSQLTPRMVETSPLPTQVSATVPAERKLKVQLHLGSGKPWFEVRDGEEVVLKVASDAVEVKAPADNGDAASLLRASGGVTFRTLGGNGTCDELRVVPGTGEVVVSGRVAVTSNWGKSETTATAEKMTFRLGEVGAVRK